jgi:hypothetical protein
MTTRRVAARIVRGVAVCLRTLQELSRFVARPGMGPLSS